MSQMLSIAVDPGNVLGRQLTDLERKQLPFAMQRALNDTAFQLRQEWAETMTRVFDRPTPLTQRAVLYRKATRERLTAEIFLRDEAFKGTPPAKYLQAQVMGGTRRQTGKERKLVAAGLLPAGHFVVPGAGAQLDAWGNISLGQVNRILSQIGAQGDATANESAASRGRRNRREGRKTGYTTQFFALKQRRGRLAAGVYQRIRLGRLGSAVRSVLRFVSGVSYRPRYRIFNLAQRLFDRRFPENFERSLYSAVASAWAREFRR